MTQRLRTLSIGGATYDLFVQTGANFKDEKVIALPLGAKIPVKSVIETCGGGASNSSVGLRRLGCESSFCGIVGSDQWGERLLHNLQAEGVDIRGATIVEEETSSFSIILRTESGERVILYTAGTNEHMHDATFDKEQAASVDWVYLNHIQETGCMIQDDLSDILRANPTVGLTWNPGGCQIERGMQHKDNLALLRETDLLLCNKEEALVFTGTKSVKEALRALTATGAKIVSISDGKRGAVATDGKKLFRCPVIENAPIVDTTGAGDAFGVGMTWALLCRKDLPTMLRAGTINATSVLGSIGAEAGLLTDIEMQTQLGTVHLAVESSDL